MTMNEQLKAVKADLRTYFADLESRIDEDQEARLASQWRDFADGKCPANCFSPLRTPRPSSIVWPNVYVNEGFLDTDLMIYCQLKSVSDLLSGKVGTLLSVRANYGTGIIPSMFGAEIFFLEDKLNTLPGAKALEGGVEELEQIVNAHEADYSRGLVPQVFAFGQRWTEIVKDFPRIRRYVYLYMPDLQGPYPLVDMLGGSDLFYTLYDDPDLVHRALEFMTEVYLELAHRWLSLYPPFDDTHAVEWGFLHKGILMVRNDAIMNISREMYQEFAMPYDRKIFRELTGILHFCGKGDHYIEDVCSMEGVCGINMTQPEYNDMEVIYRTTIDRGMTIIGMNEEEIWRTETQGRPLKGRVHSDRYSTAKFNPADCLRSSARRTMTMAQRTQWG